MSGITLSAAVRSNLLSLQNTAALLDTTQTRLSTGNRVTSALDSPTNYFAAASLNARAGDLGNLLDGVSNAIQTIQAANDGVSGITRLVQSAQATANQALQLSATVPTGTASISGGSFTTLDVSDPGSGSATTGSIDFGTYSNLNLSSGSISFDLSMDGFTQVSPITINAGWIAIYNSSAAPADQVADVSNITLTEFTKVLNAAQGAWYGPSTFTNDGSHLSIAAFAPGASHSIGLLNLTETGITGSTGLANHAPVAGTDAGPAASVAFSLDIDGAGNQPISISAAAVTTYNGAHGTSLSAGALSAQDVADIINSQAGTSVASVVTGNLKLTSATAGANSSLAVSGFASAGTVGGSTGLSNSSATGSSTTGPNPARAALIGQYNGLLSQIDQMARDASYNGNNLLIGSATQLKVVFNETGASSLTVSGKDATSTGLGLAVLGSGDFDTDASISTVLSRLHSAQETLRSDATSFGSNLSIVQIRQDFTKALVSTLQTGASNLTLADSNEEAANLLALQTRQSLSTKALSLAAQSDQNVLRLLQ